MQIAPAGDRALLVTLGDVTAGDLHARTAALRAIPDVIACVPGHASVLVVFSGKPDPAAIRGAAAASATGARSGHRSTVVPVHFDGADLPEFLALHNLTREAFLARVSELRLTARYLGFRGGFAYLDGWPPEWAMPRRPTSRPVPRGSFAIAGSVAGFYPIDTPGGWNLLGITNEELEHRFEPGDEIRIHVGQTLLSVPPRHAEKRRTDKSVCPTGIEIITGPLVTVVGPIDWSRVERGLSPGGPFDHVAARAANRAVGNAPEAPLLECPMSGPRVRFERLGVVAWFDGELQIDRVAAGEERAFGRVRNGLRGYLAFGENAQPERIERGNRLVIEAIAGPHDIGLRELECVVTPKLDRVGIRMTPSEKIAVPADLPSCGMLCGTMQLHPDGSVVVMGPDHPVTGGYLQPMTVISSERWKLAQLSPGERVRFVARQLPY